MTILIKQIIGLIQLLHSENGENQIAWGLALGIFLGFAPFFSIQTVLVLFIVFIFRIQFGAAALSAFFFKFIAFLMDPLADIIGRSVLESESFRPLWIQMYNLPILPMTRFNNSINMGSFIISLVLCPVLFFVFKKMIIQYRSRILTKMETTLLWKSFKASKIYNWYSKYNDLYGPHQSM